MTLFFEPLFEEDNHEHCRHDKVQPFRIEGDQGAEQSAEHGARNPVDLVVQCHKEHEPAPVCAFGNPGRAVDRKAFVTHAENKIDLFASEALKSVQHGDAVE